MSLPLPVLDDRGYQELIDGMRERLPRTAPAWTDHNASDPGITLLELFAYFGDALSYRFDRISPRVYRAFLRLVGCAPRAAQVAFAPVTFGCEPGAALDLAPGVQVASESPRVVFRTGTPFRVTDAALAAVIVSCGGRWVDRTRDNADLGTPFAALGPDPQPGDALYLGFDRALGDAAARLRLWMFGPDLAQDAGVWQALLAEWRRRLLPRSRGCANDGVAPFAHYGARVAWEYFDGLTWRALDALKDRTRALSLSGPLRWRGSAAHASGGVPGHETKYFIRCRLVAGAYDCAPMIRGVRINAVPARHAADDAGVVSPARSTGAASQRFVLSKAPVVPGSVRLTLTAADGTVERNWRERADFDRSGPHARHFVLDPAAGRIEFGDGSAGAVPEAGSTLAAIWRVGGGLAGNLPAKSLSRALGGAAPLTVNQPVAACGGSEAESLDAAKARAFHKVSTERCAATLQDFEHVALEAPGLPIARAFAVAETHPDMQCLKVAGCVSVVIVPRCVDRRRDPTPALCAALAHYLDARRPLALELHVTGPNYTVVHVAARLALAADAKAAAVFAAARDALREFLHPLDGGPDGRGWKVGRTVYRSEVLAVLDAIQGVHHVAELTLTAGEGEGALCGDIPLCANGLVISGDHVFTTADGAAR